MSEQDESLRLCVFAIGKQTFAIDIMRIREIVRPSPLTRVPKAPFGMEGLIDLRGEVLPIFDLRLRLDLKSRHDVELSQARFLITRLGRRQLGLAVDRVIDVIDVKRSELRINKGLSMIETPFYIGVCPFKDELAILLNLHEIVSSEDRQAIDRVALMTREDGNA